MTKNILEQTSLPNLRQTTQRSLCSLDTVGAVAKTSMVEATSRTEVAKSAVNAVYRFMPQHSQVKCEKKHVPSPQGKLAREEDPVSKWIKRTNQIRQLLFSTSSASWFQIH
jgi:hypothetical protein